MSRFRIPLASMLATLMLGAAALAIAPALLAVPQEGETGSKFYSEGLDGVNLSGLTEERQRLALQILNESSCICGCNMTVAQCRVEDQYCDTSPRLARAIVDAVRRGESEMEIRAAYDRASGKREKPTLQKPVDRFVIPLLDSPGRGEATAPVTIVEFVDFQSPFSMRALRVLNQLFEIYPGKLRLVFKHLPMSIHEDARTAALAAEAAHAQGRFWEMHDLLFLNPGTLDQAGVLLHAAELDLDMKRFEADLGSTAVADRVDRDLAEAERVQAVTTPILYVNGRRQVNNRLNTLRRTIEEELAAAGN